MEKKIQQEAEAKKKVQAEIEAKKKTELLKKEKRGGQEEKWTWNAD